MTFQITLEDYLMGRDKVYPEELTDDIVKNATETVRRANLLLGVAAASGVNLMTRPGVNHLVASGWRPPEINANIYGAAKKSRHISGEAVDIFDGGDRLDDWLMTAAGQKVLETAGLWLEHPNATPNWSHVQIVPPKSGRRVFVP